MRKKNNQNATNKHINQYRTNNEQACDTFLYYLRQHNTSNGGSYKGLQHFNWK